MEVSRYLHESLDMLAIGACEYDSCHRAIGWNRTFLHFFPEHDGRIHSGEPYADNLRRFYSARLGPEEIGEIERYIADGVARHEGQTQPFEFSHCGRRLRASSLRSPCGGRVRLWQAVGAVEHVLGAGTVPPPAIEALDFIPDGATILDAEDRIVAANAAFRQLYDIPADRSVVGASLDQIIRDCWRVAVPDAPLPASVRNGLRYDGAPLEVELPGERWRRVIARHTADGIGCFVHADISTVKRQHTELLRMQQALREANTELASLAGTDSLTGLANRRRFVSRLADAAALPKPLTLMMIDVDHFKAINDRFGHLVGDACLKAIAEVIAAQVTSAAGLVARIGGEEFGVLLGDTCLDAAHEAAVSIRIALRRVPWHLLHDELTGVTVSIGLCAGEGPLDGTTLHAGADKALYAAKRNGRDRIEPACPAPLVRRAVS